MPDETKTVGYCAYSGQSLKGKQLREAGFHTTSDGVTHRLVRWAERRYEWVGDQLRHKVTKKLFDIHPNAKADAALFPQIEEHADPNEPKKERKSKAAKVDSADDSQTEATQSASQDVPAAEDDVPNAQPEAKPEDEEGEAEDAEPVEYDEYEPVAEVEEAPEDEVVD